MAIIQVEFMSNTLQRMVPLRVILPVDRLGKAPRTEKFKTLYLLHGLLGDSTDWLYNTRLRRWAEEQELAVVMPSGDNAFYVDKPITGNCYGAFIGDELVQVTRAMFPLSDKREDTFLGGLSMGGYGAMRNGLKYGKTFGAVISLSGALDILDEPRTGRDAAYGEALFGTLTDAVESDKNPRVAMAKLVASGVPLPRIYLACGTEDRLLSHTRKYRTLLEEAGFQVHYEEGAGGHDWDYWDAHIQKVIGWLLAKSPKNQL